MSSWHFVKQHFPRGLDEPWVQNFQPLPWDMCDTRRGQPLVLQGLYGGCGFSLGPKPPPCR
jgi:hypothetical protein